MGIEDSDVGKYYASTNTAVKFDIQDSYVYFGGNTEFYNGGPTENQNAEEAQIVYKNSASSTSGVWGTQWPDTRGSYTSLEFRLDPEPDSIITKSVFDESGDNIVQAGEKITYYVDVTNESSLVAMYDVPVRDSLIENTPEYYTYNNDAIMYDVTTNSQVVNNEHTGDLVSGSFLINELPAGATYRIVYSFTASSDVSELISVIDNAATDNGTNPIDCSENNRDCAIAQIPTQPLEGLSETGFNTGNLGIILGLTITLVFAREKF